MNTKSPSEYTPQEINALFNLSEEEYLTISEVEFRARFRERIHHTLEIQTYASIESGKPLTSKQTETAKKFLRLWDERQLSHDLPEYIYATTLVSFANARIHSKTVDLAPYSTKSFSDADQGTIANLICERRSVRHFTDQKVSKELVQKILKSGLWAAHSCNLQSIRYLVVNEESEQGLFKGSDVPGGPVHLVVLQDERVYKANPFNPVRNRLIDVGAATQNLVLAAHALGLASVWLTFNDPMKERLRKRFNLPDYISIQTYIDIGYGTQTPYPPQRTTLEEAILEWIE